MPVRYDRHWPVGVLYDLFTGRDPTVTSADEEDEHSLPWKLVLRFQNFPIKHIMRIDSGNTFQGVWLNCLKEVRFHHGLSHHTITDN